MTPQHGGPDLQRESKFGVIAHNVCNVAALTPRCLRLFEWLIEVRELLHIKKKKCWRAGVVVLVEVF